MYSSSTGHRGVTSILLNAGANIECRTKKGSTPLALAALNGHNTVVTALLEHKAVLDAPNQIGFTALMNAAQNGHK